MHAVNACSAPANITFTMRFKLKRGSGPTGPEETKIITKQLTVCPFEFNPQVSAVSVTQAAVGQDSTVNLTISP